MRLARLDQTGWVGGKKNPSVSRGKLVDDQKTSDYEGVTLDVQEVTGF
jgi:hypothetical protein